MRSTDKRLATAYHEAGHAVVSWALGFNVKTISIRKTQRWDGFAEFDNPLAGYDPNVILTSRTRKLLESAVMIRLAGAIAQRKHAPSSYKSRDADMDHDAALEFVERLSQHPDNVQPLVSRLGRRTERLVNRRKRQIASIAGRLVRRKAIRCKELRRLFMPLKPRTSIR